VVLVGLVLVLVLAGLVYQFVATRLDYRRYLAPGEMVAVAGHDMQLYCTGAGKGGPTVVMDAGLGGGLLDWQTIQSEVAKFARVCSYDRSGIAWSEAGPDPRTSPRIVEKLHTLLKNAGVDGPYVLVGHSFGGANVQLYAAEYPDEVAGMVLVDSALDLRVLDKDLRDDAEGVAPSPLTIKLVARLGIACLAAGGDESESGDGGPPQGSRRRGTRSTMAPAPSTRSPMRAPMCKRASPRRPTQTPRWGTSRL
jgi:pimeloyl-ACP methyl ester carboxylesterase